MGCLGGKESNLSINVNHGWQQESKSLSGSRGRDADHIASEKSHGPALRLNRCGGRKSLLEHLSLHILGHGCLLEGHDGLHSHKRRRDSDGTMPNEKSGKKQAQMGQQRLSSRAGGRKMKREI